MIFSVNTPVGNFVYVQKIYIKVNEIKFLQQSSDVIKKIQEISTLAYTLEKENNRINHLNILV